MIKHTIEPWIAREGFPSEHFSTIFGADGSYVAITDNSTGPNTFPEKYEANTKLLASAPELATSLKEMLEVYWGEGDGQEPAPQCILNAQAVLRKAGLI